MANIVSNVLSSAMNVIKDIGKSLKNNALKLASSSLDEMTVKSLSQFSQSLQLRPTIAVERSIVNDANAKLLIHTAINNYSAYYVLALSVDNTVNGVSIGKLLGKYSPTRNPVDAAFDLMGKKAIKTTLESMDEVVINGEPLSVSLGDTDNLDLPTKYTDEKQLADSLVTEISKEEKTIIGVKNKEVNGQKLYDDNLSTNNEVAKELNNLNNLAVGKLITVTISRTENGNTASANVDMLVKPSLLSLHQDSIIAIASYSNRPMSMKERWIAWKDRGTIASFFDYITCRDLVSAHRKNLVQDTTGYYQKTRNRSFDNQLATALTGTFSVGTVANTFICTDVTADRIEIAIKNKLSNKKARDKFMADTGIMTLIVYNSDYQRVFVYNHGIDDVSEISTTYLESKSKDKNFIYDMFKLLSNGTSPII